MGQLEKSVMFWLLILFCGTVSAKLFVSKGKTKLNGLLFQQMLVVLKVHKTDTSILQVPDFPIKEKHDLRL